MCSSRIFDSSSSEFARLVKLLVQWFGVPFSDGLGVTLASLRAGGATFHYMSGMSLEQLRRLGCWGSSRILEYYIQDCAALALLANFPNLPETKFSVSVQWRLGCCTARPIS